MTNKEQIKEVLVELIPKLEGDNEELEEGYKILINNEDVPLIVDNVYYTELWQSKFRGFSFIDIIRKEKIYNKELSLNDNYIIFFYNNTIGIDMKFDTEGKMITVKKYLYIVTRNYIEKE